MSSRPPRRGLRRAACVLALVPALVLMGTAGTAMADAPDTWQNTPHVSATYTLVVLGGIPLLLFLVITLLVYLPSMRKRESAGDGWRGQSEWFGGPRGGLATADRSAPPAVTGGSQAPGAESVRGGDSGRW